MNDEELLKHYERMVEIYGTLPDPDHEPKQFAHLVRLYKTYYCNTQFQNG